MARNPAGTTPRKCLVPRPWRRFHLMDPPSVAAAIGKGSKFRLFASPASANQLSGRSPARPPSAAAPTPSRSASAAPRAEIIGDSISSASSHVANAREPTAVSSRRRLRETSAVGTWSSGRLRLSERSTVRTISLWLSVSGPASSYRWRWPPAVAQRAADAGGRVLGPHRLVQRPPTPGDRHHGQPREALEQRQPGVARRVDDRGREHGRVQVRLADRLLGERLCAEEPRAMVGRGAEHGEEQEALHARSARRPRPSARWRCR